MSASPEQRLEELQLELPSAPPPGGLYRPVVIAGGFVYVSGHGPVLPDGSLIKGKVGSDLTLSEGKAAARQVGLTMLATLRAELGSLDRLLRIVKVLGMVNCLPGFTQQPQVMNGFSELMRDIWGEEHGVAARSAVGMHLPENIAVEVEAIFELA
jgi:enamine deaminase RidA (YjgF/YER057c/UK114 family)